MKQHRTTQGWNLFGGIFCWDLLEVIVRFPVIPVDWLMKGYSWCLGICCFEKPHLTSSWVWCWTTFVCLAEDAVEYTSHDLTWCLMFACEIQFHGTLENPLSFCVLNWSFSEKKVAHVYWKSSNFWNIRYHHSIWPLIFLNPSHGCQIEQEVAKKTMHHPHHGWRKKQPEK